MNRTIAGPLLVAALVLSPSTASADLKYEEIIDGYYSVSYEVGTMMRGGLLDTQDRVESKLIKKTHKLCLAEGYGYLKLLTLQEVARNEPLRAAWLESNEEMADESAWDKYVERLLETETHSARKIVRFSKAQDPDLEKCSK